MIDTVENAGKAIDGLSVIKNLTGNLMQLPQLLGSLFMVIPQDIISSISAGILIAIALRIAGR